jgi:hypothetical protein
LKKGATYDDLVRVPEHYVAEMFDGELYASPRPACPHARAAGVLLDPDVALRFRSSAAVNEALRKLLKTPRTTRRPAARAEARERNKARKVRR